MRWMIVAAALLASAACGGEPDPSPSEETEPSGSEEAELAEPTVPGASVPEPGDESAEQGRPADFEPVTFPEVGDSCAGSTMWIGPHVTTFGPPPRSHPNLPPPDLSEYAEGIELDVARFVRPPNLIAMGTGSYNGPGGEPLFRFHLEHGLRRVIVFDHRVSRERLEAALRGTGAELDGIVTIGGVDREGQRVCALITTAEPADMLAQPANRVLEGSVEEHGALLVSGHRLAAEETEAALPDEDEEGLHIVRVHADPSRSTSAVLRALAVARRGERRYAWYSAP